MKTPRITRAGLGTGIAEYPYMTLPAVRDDDNVSLFEQAQRERREKNAAATARIDRVARGRSEVLGPLAEDGFARLESRVPADVTKRIRARFDSFCSTGRHLQLPADVASHHPAAPYATAPRLDAQLLKRGVKHWRDRTTHVNVEDPLIHVPEILEIAFDPELLEVAGAYLGCPPLLGFVKLTRSFVNDLPTFDTEQFHVDGNGTTMVKAFVHLHDTDEGAGAHRFVRGSHVEPVPGWDATGRASDAFIERFYGADRVVVQEAGPGEILLEDTTGFHRRGKAVARDRTLLILNYVAYEEYGGGGARTRIPAADLVQLDAFQRMAAELLVPFERTARRRSEVRCASA